MTRENWLNFEIMIADMAEQEDIKTADNLQNFSEELHEHIEDALWDYAHDNDFGDDYSPMY